MKFFVTKFFVETGKNAAHCKKMSKSGRNLQRAANF